MSMGPFSATYCVQSVTRFEKTGRRDLEEGGKVILPPSALARLVEQGASSPFLFEIKNKERGFRVHCGVHEFIADEGMCAMPEWMAKCIRVNTSTGGGVRDQVLIKSVSLPKGKFVKMRPMTNKFLETHNPRAILEKSLRSFSALGTGEVFRIYYNQREYDIEVTQVQPDSMGAVCIIDADVEVDFDVPPDAPMAAQPQAPAVPVYIPPIMDSSEEEDGNEEFVAFQGSSNKVSMRKGKEEASGSNVPKAKPAKPALQWKLKFTRHDGQQPMHAEEEEDGFVPFQGDAKTVRERRSKK